MVVTAKFTNISGKLLQAGDIKGICRHVSIFFTQDTSGSKYNLGFRNGKALPVKCQEV